MRDTWKKNGLTSFQIIALISIFLFHQVSSFITGSFQIPHNDAWSHSLIAINFAESGRIELVGWNRAFLLGQIIPFWPFSKSIEGQHLQVALLSALSLFFLFKISSLYLGKQRAFLVLFVLVTIPEFGLLSTSYMSDIPAISILMIAIYQWEKSQRAFITRGYSNRLLFLFFGLWSTLIREQGIVIILLLSTISFQMATKVHRIKIRIELMVLLLILVLCEYWRRMLPNSDSPKLRVDPKELLSLPPRIILYLALCLLPVALGIGIIKVTKRKSLLALLPSMLLVLFALLNFKTAFQGNYIKMSGSYSEVITYGEKLSLFSNAFWLCLILIAGISFFALLNFTINKDFKNVDTPALIALAVVVSSLVQAVIGQTVFSRYLLLAIPFMAISLLRNSEQSRYRVKFAYLGVVFMFILSTIITSNAQLRDSATWKLADYAKNRYPSAYIDGGLAWNGFNRESISHTSKGLRCLRVSGSKNVTGKTLKVVSYRTSWLGGSSSLFLVDSHACEVKS